MNTIARSLLMYQPTAQEIRPVADELRLRWPQLWTRIDKAEAILNEGGLLLDVLAWQKSQLVQWRVTSQYDPTQHYVIGRLLHCGCTDANIDSIPPKHPSLDVAPRKPAVRPARIDGVFYCKHALAVAIYRRILKLHFNDDVRRQVIELGVMLDGNLIAHADRLGIVIMTRDEDFPLSDGVPGYSFHDAASAVRYGLWLGEKQAVTEPISSSVPSVTEVLS